MTHVIALDPHDRYGVLPASAELPDGWRLTGWCGEEQTCRRQVAERPSAALDTERLRLREVLPAEAPELKEGKSAGLDWLGGTPGEGSQEAAGLLAGAHAAGLHRSGWGMYVLVRREDGLVVGGMGFHGPPAEGHAEIGFDLHPDARGRGYATEALSALAHWALRQDGVDTVLATTTQDNTPSQGVMERAGFGRRPDRDGLLVYALTR
ncbi:GNAT family N-acetyltransferase [Streptomyces sp. NPDC047022]|uniref:GNAT family N-acetyltransferase n=1 Tax=Streptomyces sp. NPDC047022 TaxID=3155737 RepID=UPI0033F1CD8F